MCATKEPDAEPSAGSVRVNRAIRAYVGPEIRIEEPSTGANNCYNQPFLPTAPPFSISLSKRVSAATQDNSPQEALTKEAATGDPYLVTRSP